MASGSSIDLRFDLALLLAVGILLKIFVTQIYSLELISVSTKI